MDERARQEFLKIYSQLPLNLRKEVILVLDEEGPITWEVAYFEIENKTDKARTILKKLKELDII